MNTPTAVTISEGVALRLFNEDGWPPYVISDGNERVALTIDELNTIAKYAPAVKELLGCYKAFWLEWEQEGIPPTEELKAAVAALETASV